MGKIEEYKLRRYKRLLSRLDGDDDEGKWITTENNHKVHLNENGEPDKGNPHVIEAMGVPDAAFNEYSDKLHNAVKKAKESASNYSMLSDAVYALPDDVIIEVDGVSYKKNKKSGEIKEVGGYGWLRPSSLMYTDKIKVYKDESSEEKDKAEGKQETKSSDTEAKVASEKAVASESSIKPFKIKHSEEAFSQDRKDNAMWDMGDGSEADKLLRPITSKVWKGLSSDARDSLFIYTTDKDYGYQDINKMMREGAPNWWTSYDTGKVQKNIDNITKAIDKSEAPRDMWVQRGIPLKNLKRLFNISDEQFNSAEHDGIGALLDAIKSSAPYGQDNGFMSCGSTKGHGFTGNDVILNIYCPKGTQMLYAEPFSAFGHGGGKSWNGTDKQTWFSSENETIIQRGTKLVPTKITKSNGKYYVDVEVIGQEYSDKL